jgi:hypothetical protein
VPQLNEKFPDVMMSVQKLPPKKPFGSLDASLIGNPPHALTPLLRSLPFCTPPHVLSHPHQGVLVASFYPVSFTVLCRCFGSVFCVRICFMQECGKRICVHAL